MLHAGYHSCFVCLPRLTSAFDCMLMSNRMAVAATRPHTLHAWVSGTESACVEHIVFLLECCHLFHILASETS
jgi:hypothetical protein